MSWDVEADHMPDKSQGFWSYDAKGLALALTQTRAQRLSLITRQQRHNAIWLPRLIALFVLAVFGSGFNLAMLGMVLSVPPPWWWYRLEVALWLIWIPLVGLPLLFLWQNRRLTGLIHWLAAQEDELTELIERRGT